MKTLYLLRHAKSSWKEPELADRERGLNGRGRRDAPRMGQALARRLAPMPAWCSPARRAQLTLAGLCEGWPELAACDHHVEETLYTFSSGALLAWLRAQRLPSEALFLIGHNPALTELVNLLVGDEVLYNLPTAGFAKLALDVQAWGDLGPGCATLADTLFPRQLGSVQGDNE